MRFTKVNSALVIEHAIKEVDNLYIRYDQHHACWWPDDALDQDINENGID